MSYVAAIYTGKKLVVGSHHGDAFNKLSVEEQDDISLKSGFFDPESGFFICDEQSFYFKQLILIRHASIIKSEFDPGLSEFGVEQCYQATEFLIKNFDLTDFMGFYSPCRRCKETASAINIKTSFLPCELVQDRQNYETTRQFLLRLQEALKFLPTKSIVITHGDCIDGMSQLSSGKEAAIHKEISYCSSTYVNNHDILWFGRKM